MVFYTLNKLNGEWIKNACMLEVTLSYPSQLAHMPVYKLDSRSSLVREAEFHRSHCTAISHVADDACIVSIDNDNAVYSRI